MTDHSEREDMANLADKIDAINKYGSTVLLNTTNAKMVVKALRSASAGAGYGAGWTVLDNCLSLLKAVDHTLSVHGHLDAGTPLHDRVERTIDLIAALPAPAGESVTGWQPIETAPKDGTPIIGAFWSIRWADSHRKGDVVRCWWQPEFEAFISSCREMTLAPGLTFENGSSRELHSPVIEPVTHWKPLDRPTITRKSRSEAGS